MLEGSMATWFWFWIIVTAAAAILFFGVAVVVAVLGWRDLSDLYRHLSKPADAETADLKKDLSARP